MNQLCKDYLDITTAMAKQFYAKYYRDSKDEDADLESDYLSYTDFVGSWSKKKPWHPHWPLLLEDGMVARDIDDIRTALAWDIPKYILLDFWRNHRDDYDNKETYRTINLRHYYRKNYDPEQYEEEQRLELEKSKETIKGIGEELDLLMWNEKGTFLSTYEKLINEHTQETPTS